MISVSLPLFILRVSACDVLSGSSRVARANNLICRF